MMLDAVTACCKGLKCERDPDAHAQRFRLLLHGFNAIQSAARLPSAAQLPQRLAAAGCCTQLTFGQLREAADIWVVRALKGAQVAGPGGAALHPWSVCTAG